MAHCSEPNSTRLPAEFLTNLRAQMNPSLPEGRKWPDGRLDQSDDGEFQFGLTIIKGSVVIGFDRPVDWIGLTPQQAIDLGTALRIKGLEARGIKAG